MKKYCRFDLMDWVINGLSVIAIVLLILIVLIIGFDTYYSNNTTISYERQYTIIESESATSCSYINTGSSIIPISSTTYNFIVEDAVGDITSIGMSADAYSVLKAGDTIIVYYNQYGYIVNYALVAA